MNGRSPDYLLSCDWGTSSFRFRVVDMQTGDVCWTTCSSDGIRHLRQESIALRDYFQGIVHRAIFELSLRNARCVGVISGMASSSIGWKELPYAHAPVDVSGKDLIIEIVETLSMEDGCDRSLPILLISGIATANDVMRGEETEIIGILHQPDFARYAARSLMVLPGTHAKHVLMSDGKISDFSTYMTGELFALLRTQSILSHSLAGASETQCDDPAFDEGVADGFRLTFLSVLFRVRSRQLLHGTAPASNLAYLNGVLIGAEINGLLAHAPGDRPILLCTGSHQAQAYARGFAVMGITERIVPVPSEIVGMASTYGQLVLCQRLCKEMCV